MFCLKFKKIQILRIKFRLYEKNIDRREYTQADKADIKYGGNSSNCP